MKVKKRVTVFIFKIRKHHHGQVRGPAEVAQVIIGRMRSKLGQAGSFLFHAVNQDSPHPASVSTFNCELLGKKPVQVHG